MKKIIVKTVARTLLYQLLILFVGFSIGFIAYPQYWGKKAPVIQRSLGNIFFHPEFTDVKDGLMNVGRLRVWAYLDFPDNLSFSNEQIIGEQLYTCDYEYRIGKEKVTGGYETFIRWKSWEAHYELTETIE